MTDEEDQARRLRAAREASQQSDKLIAHVEKLEPQIREHVGESRRLRNENGFAYLMQQIAFRSRNG